ncbi:MAG: hypothetical protein KKG14_14780 [Alphaproteobacteria bacterium]|nr:hypothetical protein [Alphaproteobacteria bacterium]MBU2269837.1 hypothetical protein [Alphaproteobacteria bacterium]MBU2419963.1 hypothetical protein [Alphaproteobacteria bacterium]
MIVEPRIAAPFLERAAAEQLRDQLTADGYAVSMEEAFGDGRADLIARKGDQTIVFEVKVPGQGRNDGWARSVAALQSEARRQAAEFRLVVVRPPRVTHVEVAGLDDLLLETWTRNLPADLDGVAATTLVEEISEIVVDSLILRDGIARIEASGEVGVRFLAGDGEAFSSEAFPFRVRAQLDVATNAMEVEDASFDLSSWYGPDE